MDSPYRKILSPVSSLRGVGKVIARELDKRGVQTVYDLLYVLPRSYQDRRKFVPIHQVRSGETALIKGKIVEVRRARPRYRSMIEMLVGNEKGIISARWMGAPPYLFRFRKGEEIVLFGRFRTSMKMLETYHPEIIEAGDEYEIGRLVPVYPEIEGISQRRIRRIVMDAINRFTQDLEDPLPTMIREAQQLPELSEAIKEVHFPYESRPEDLRIRRSRAQRRLIFDEFFMLQLALALKRSKASRERGIAFGIQGMEEIYGYLPFKLSGSQTRVVHEITTDMSRPFPMNRLLQGDVGCGKTVVALIAAWVVVRNGYQVAFMAPTQLLAEQHYLSTVELTRRMNLKAALLTSGMGSHADDLKGLGNYATVDKLKNEFGDKVGFISIGQAGEWKLAAASVAFTDQELRPTRHAGRGGLGAVMGSKGLKAIIIDPSEGELAPLADKEAFKEAAKRFANALQEHPVTSKGLTNYGTDILINIINEAGGLPIRNFASGRFETADKVGGETLNKVTTERKGNCSHGCMAGCVIRCSGIFHDEKGEYLTKWPEYETVWAFGPNCEIDDLDAIARMDRACDDIGIDTIETGNAIAVAMEGGIKKFGDATGAEELLTEIGKGTPLGRILGSGAAVVGKTFGVRRVPVVKNQAMPAYDPRSIKGIGVTYATSTMGADHTAGYAIATNIMKVGGYVDPLKAEGQVELSRNLQIATAAIDTAGLCLFVAFPVLDNPDAFNAIVDMLNAKYGLSMTGDDVAALGKRVLKMERDFNMRAGFTAADDRLPEFMKLEKFSPHNQVFDIPDKELDEFWNF